MHVYVFMVQRPDENVHVRIYTCMYILIWSLYVYMRVCMYLYMYMQLFHNLFCYAHLYNNYISCSVY